jgi:hypothetical protein
MSDPNIKQITLVSSGSGMGSSGGDQIGGKRRRTAKKKKFELDGGGGTSPGTMTQLSASHVPGTTANPVEPVGVNSNLTKVAAPLQIAGKAEPTKVVLAAAKKKSKVVLAAAKPVAHAVKARKNKTARKVRMSMVGLSRKIKVARTIKEKAKADTIDDIKKALVKATLIKTDSKAPEQMLRQMYADYMMLKKRAL